MIFVSLCCLALVSAIGNLPLNVYSELQQTATDVVEGVVLGGRSASAVGLCARARIRRRAR